MRFERRFYEILETFGDGMNKMQQITQIRLTKKTKILKSKN